MVDQDESALRGPEDGNLSKWWRIVKRTNDFGYVVAHVNLGGTASPDESGCRKSLALNQLGPRFHIRGVRSLLVGQFGEHGSWIKEDLSATTRNIRGTHGLPDWPFE